METIIGIKEKAKAVHANVDASGKDSLEQVFGKKTFQSVFDRVKSFEEACAETGRDPNDSYFSSARPHENAFRKWEEVCLALNEGVELSFKNPKQEKWYVWVIYEGSGFRFVVVSCTDTGTVAGLGSRLCLVSRRHAEHFGKYFMDLINAAMGE
jgi:hypothetical protein